MAKHLAGLGQATLPRVCCYLSTVLECRQQILNLFRVSTPILSSEFFSLLVGSF